jgi:subtilase family serine protease
MSLAAWLSARQRGGRSGRITRGALAAGLALGAVAAATTVGATVVRAKPDLPQAAGLPATAHLIGAVPGTSELRLDVELAPRSDAALARFATEVSTPGDGEFGHFLEPGAFAARFGPTVGTIAEVTHWLSGTGLSVIGTTSNHLTVQVRGTAATVERAFETRLERFRLASGVTSFANASPPIEPDSVRPYIEAIVGMEGMNPTTGSAVARATAAPRSAERPAANGPEACSAATTAGKSKHVYTASQLASAYDFTGLYAGNDEGAGVTVGIFELGPNLPSDITSYQACFGTHATVNYVKVDGGAGTGAGNGEAALDIETVIGLAPEATVDVYQAPRSSTGIIDDFSAMVDDDSAKVLSTSWGACESTNGASLISAEGTLFEQAAAQGQSVVAATGDDGSTDCNTSTLAVDDPASQPFVTGVGGTTLSSLGPPPTETAWNDSSIRTGAGGGGVSSMHVMPSYQADAPSALHVVNHDSSGTQCHAPTGSYCREVPDVSADADRSTGYLIYFDGAWSANGGTSAAAPLWAALFALADASPSCKGQAVGFANPALYGAASSSYAKDFNDVTSGNNDYSPDRNTSGLYPATTGYDMATGLGTPIATNLVATMCSLRTAVSVATTTMLRLSMATITYGAEGRETFTVTVSGRANDGRPIGRFDVDNGGRLLCSGALKGSTATKSVGTCRLTAREFTIGRHRALLAIYSPAGASSSKVKVAYIMSRSSPRKIVTVVKATS